MAVIILSIVWVITYFITRRPAIIESTPREVKAVRRIELVAVQPTHFPQLFRQPVQRKYTAADVKEWSDNVKRCDELHREYWARQKAM